MIDILARVEFLAPIPPAGLACLAEQGRARAFRAGSPLIRQGEVRGSLHVIVSGTVRVERAHPLMHEPLVLAEIDAGEVVGELGLLDGEACADTVRAIGDTVTVELRADAVAATLLRFPEAEAGLLPVLSRRLGDGDALAAEGRRRGWHPAQF